MARCKFCGQTIEWISTVEGKPVPVDPEPVFVIESDEQVMFQDSADAAASAETFLDDMGIAIIGRKARPEEEHPDLPVAFIPHRRTCPWASYPAPRRVEYGAAAGGLLPAI